MTVEARGEITGVRINSVDIADVAVVDVLVIVILDLHDLVTRSEGPAEPLDFQVAGIYVADRLNSRIQVFDQDGNFITAWNQFGQPSSVFVGPDDKIYVGVAFRDEATRRNPTSRVQPGELRGMMVGSAIDGSLLAFIPDPNDLSTVGAGTSASGIAADAMGNVYAADVGANKVRKYILQR